MAVMDEFKKEREELLKNASFKEKFSYYVYYYKWHVIIAVLCVVMVVSFIVEYMNNKDRALYICMLNTAERLTSETTLDTDAALNHSAEFMEYAEINAEEYEVYCDTSMTIDVNSMDENTINSSQKLMTYLAAAELDVMVTDVNSLEFYAYQDDFHDLRDILTPEQITAYEPYFYYIDMARVRDWNAFLDEADNLYTDYNIEAPDPRNPEAMEEPIPVGIYMNDCEKLDNYFYFIDDDVVASIFINTKHLDASLQYIDFLMTE